MKLIATYRRVSTSAQEEQETIKTQIDTLARYAGENGLTIIKEYKDEGWSGDTLIRPGLDQLRVDARKKLWEAVLIYDPDRLARRYSYQELVHDELREAGIEVIFVTVSAPQNMEDKILYGVRGLFSEYERAKISERFRLGKLRKVREGHILTSVPLYGFHYIRNNKETKEHGYYIINEEEAEVVQKIFAWVGNEGLTLRQVVLRLKDLKIKPKKSKRGVWNTSTLTTMLRHRGYIGEAHWGSSYAVVPENPTNTEKYRQVKKSSRRIKPENEWIAPNISVPVIVERELFMKVREQLKANSAFCERNTKNEYLLGSKIFCSCGKKRCGEGPKHGEYLYYRCTDRIYSFPLPYTCKERGINARIADRLVWQKIAGLMSSPELLLGLVNRRVGIRKDKIQSSAIDIGAIEKEIAKLKAKMDRYNKAYGAELFSLEKLKEYTIPIKSQIVALELQMRSANQGKDQISAALMPSEEQIKTFTANASKSLIDLSFEAKRAIVINTVDKIIGTQRELQVSGNIPLTLDYVEFKTNHRYCGSAERGEVHAF